MPVCCVECFDDPVLKRIISENGRQADCDYCGAKRTQCGEPALLAATFGPLLKYYRPSDGSEKSDQGLRPQTPDWFGRPETGTLSRWFARVASDGDTLPELLQDDWEIVNETLDDSIGNRLLLDILSDGSLGLSTTDLSHDWTYSERASTSNLPARWQTFANHMRSERRFIPDRKNPRIFDVGEVLRGYAHLVEDELQEGEEFYRARLGGRQPETTGLLARLSMGRDQLEPHPVQDMGVPPAEKVVGGGRLNPPGIRILYLAYDRDTAVAEKRPWTGSFISVATYETTRPIKVANLTRVKYLRSPFGVADLGLEVGSRLLFDFLDDEFAKPVDPSRENIDYVPTQYVAEVLRDAGFEGIVYRSALGHQRNLALFELNAARCLSTELVQVQDLRYRIEVPEWIKQKQVMEEMLKGITDKTGPDRVPLG